MTCSSNYVTKWHRYDKPRRLWYPRIGQPAIVHEWRIAFYNSGLHLYLTAGEPRFLHREELHYLPYTQFCHGGIYNDVDFHSLGHLYGVNGGPVTITVNISGLELDLTIPPGKMVWFFEDQHQVHVYLDKRPRRITGTHFKI